MTAYRDAIAGALAAIRQGTGNPVKLIRDGMQTPNVPARAGRGAQRTDVGDELVAKWNERDFLIGVADYAFDGTPSEPQEGDEIEETINGTLTRWRVHRRNGVDCWKHSDEGQTQYRVLTIRAAT